MREVLFEPGIYLYHEQNTKRRVGKPRVNWLIETMWKRTKRIKEAQLYNEW